jgi:hypothetical protein
MNFRKTMLLRPQRRIKWSDGWYISSCKTSWEFGELWRRWRKVGSRVVDCVVLSPGGLCFRACMARAWPSPKTLSDIYPHIWLAPHSISNLNSSLNHFKFNLLSIIRTKIGPKMWLASFGCSLSSSIIVVFTRKPSNGFHPSRIHEEVTDAWRCLYSLCSHAHDSCVLPSLCFYWVWDFWD